MHCSQTHMRYPYLPLPPVMTLFPAHPDQSHRGRVRQANKRLERDFLVMPGTKASICTCSVPNHPHHDVRGIEQLPNVPSETPRVIGSNHACFGLPHPCHVPKGWRRLAHVHNAMPSVTRLTRTSSDPLYLHHARKRNEQTLYVQSA